MRNRPYTEMNKEQRDLLGQTCHERRTFRGIENCFIGIIASETSTETAIRPLWQIRAAQKIINFLGQMSETEVRIVIDRAKNHPYNIIKAPNNYSPHRFDDEGQAPAD